VIATVQRVSEAKVEINNSIYSEIGDGVLILLCVEAQGFKVGFTNWGCV